jgi:hypothetical protein
MLCPRENARLESFDVYFHNMNALSYDTVESNDTTIMNNLLLCCWYAFYSLYLL